MRAQQRAEELRRVQSARPPRLPLQRAGRRCGRVFDESAREARRKRVTLAEPLDWKLVRRIAAVTQPPGELRLALWLTPAAGWKGSHSSGTRKSPVTMFQAIALSGKC